MSYSTASLVALNTAVTGGSGLTAKLAILLPGLHDAIVKELCSNGIATPQQQQRLVAVRAELAANVAATETALGA